MYNVYLLLQASQINVCLLIRIRIFRLAYNNFEENKKKLAAQYGLFYVTQLIKMSKSNEEINEIKSFNAPHTFIHIIIGLFNLSDPSLEYISEKKIIIVFAAATEAAALAEYRLFPLVNLSRDSLIQPLPSI